jgi:hypothetical protein
MDANDVGFDELFETRGAGNCSRSHLLLAE